METQLVSKDVWEGVQEAHFHSSIEQCPSRKRESSISTDYQCPTGKRRSIPNPTKDDVSLAVPASHGMQNNQAQNIVMVKNAEALAKVNLVMTKGVRFLTTEIVGKQFYEYIKHIWSCLMDDHMSSIGIHGIGGVGKTEIAKLINNLLLHNPNKFHHVFWVNMSPSRTTMNRSHRVRNLQSSISKAVGVDLSDGDDVNKRAAQLSEGLARKKKSVLILDDVWDCISLQEVGIPVGVDRCTVLFTTRSMEVCRKLGCQSKIEIRCLLPHESYELFKKNIRLETTLLREVEDISRLVADKCVGLPLAITIMARELKGVTDKCKWRNALRGFTQKKADMEIFQNLKISYDYLKDAKLQHSFLYCPLLIADEREGRGAYADGVKRRRLGEYLVDEGIIKRMNSRREELDEALIMLNILRDFGLLEITSCNVVKMNALIRSMAVHIMEENKQGTMVKNGMSLKDLPDKESWTGDLVRVSLEGNAIKNIPANFSPSCPKLSTLLLGQNHELRSITDLFFKGMPGLKVLDLSSTRIESLPGSVCHLVNLTTLLLSWCLELKNIPSVAELQALKKLELSFSGVEKVPEGIEFLPELTYLDLYHTQVKELDSAILATLSHLQFLRLPCSFAVKGEAVARLGRLETLTCNFDSVVELNMYLRHMKGGFEEGKPPIQLDVQVGSGCKSHTNDLLYDGGEVVAKEDDDWSVLGLHNCNINKEADMLNYFQDIVIVECNEARSLCNFSPIKGAIELKHFSIQGCDGLELLCSLSSLTGQEGVLENIEYMELSHLKNLSVLVKKERDVAYGSCFSNLTRFLIQGCPSIKGLFPIHLLPNLKNLQRLYVLDCPVMEEIFGAEEEEEESRMVELKRYGLPKLSILWFVDLPKLKRICGGGGTICGIAKRCSIKVQRCPNITNAGFAVNGIVRRHLPL